MSTLTDAIRDQVSISMNVNEVSDLTAVAAASSNLTGTATRVPSSLNTYTVVPSTGVVVLPSLLTGEGNWPIIICNDGANALTVYAYADVGGHAEKINGTASTFGGATGGVSIAAGSAGVFFAEDIPKGRKGSSTANSLNWSAQVFS